MIELKKREKERGELLELASVIHSGAEDYVNRIHSIINYLSAADPELIDDKDRWYMYELLRDHLPTEDQAKKMFEL